jgi:type II secretory pathway pseudopilin PulG
MQIIIHKNGNQLGPFSESQVSEMLRSGQVAGTDLAWSEGMETWKPLSSFAQLQASAGGPPPIPGQAPALPPQRRTESLSIWSLVLGIISIVGCSVGGFLAGIPAVICGHVGMSRIKRDPSLDGKGMALAGLITGYIGMLVLVPAILFALAIPAIVTAKEKAKMTQWLSNMKQIHLVLQQAQLDSKTTGDSKLGFPADAKYTSAAQVKKMLIENGYLKADDLDRLQFDKISIGNVSADDPPDTILLQSKPENGRSTIIFLKGGDGRIERPGQQPSGRPPPRTPAFLE